MNIHFLRCPANTMAFECDEGYIESMSMCAETQRYISLEAFKRDIVWRSFVFILYFEWKWDKGFEDPMLWVRWCAPREDWVKRCRVVRYLGPYCENEEFYKKKGIPKEVWERWNE